MRIAVVTRNKPDAEGTLPLFVRISHGGQKRYVSLGIRIPKGDWNPKKREVRAGNAHADQLNEILRERRATAEAAALAVQGGGRHYTADDVKAAVVRALDGIAPGAAEAPGVIPYARAMLRAYDARGKVSSALAYGTGVNALAAYGGEGLRWDALTPAFMRAFAAHLYGQGKRDNTVAKYVSAVRLVCRRAEDEGIPGAAEAVRAVKAVRLRRERGNKPRLSFDEVGRIEALPLPPGPARDVRDFFVFAFYAGGMRFSDVCLLRWEHVDTGGEPWRVRWKQRKTSDPHSLPVLPAARAILEDWHGRTGPEGYVFGIVDEGMGGKKLRNRIGHASEDANAHLRAICREAEVPGVTFHASRHSVADHLRRSGVDLYTISKALGHATLKQTEVYLRSFDEEDMDVKLGAALRRPGPGS